MRKQLLSILMLSIVILSSCSKKTEVETAQPDQKLYPLNLKVSAFSTEIVGFSSNGKLSVVNNQATGGNPVTDVINQIDYVIFNASGALVKTGSQSLLSPTFGTIAEQLPVGNYQVHIAGSNSRVTFSTWDSKYVTISFIGSYSDLFKKSIDITVSADTKSQDVVLDRIVGKLEVQITDAIPENVAKISVSSDSHMSLTLTQANRDGGQSLVAHDALVPPTERGKSNFTISKYILISPGIGFVTSDVSIRAYDAAGTLLADKIIKNVKVEMNKKTILSGNVFTQPASNNGFAVRLNSDWNAETNNVNF